MPSKVKNNLAQLAKIERYIARFQLLSNIHGRTLTEHNDQLDFTWKQAFEAGNAEAKVSRQAAANAAVDAEYSTKIQQLRLQLSTRKSELDQAVLETAEAKQKLLDQAKRHQQRVDELKAEIEQKPELIEATLGFVNYSGHIVENWRDSWKWISNWCFGLIVFFATTPIPPEVLAVLPENIRYYVIAFTAFCGFVGRYLNQSKGIQTWPLKS